MPDQRRSNLGFYPPTQLVHLAYEQAFLNGVQAMVDFIRDNGGSIIGFGKEVDSTKYLEQRLKKGEIQFRRDFGLEEGN